MAETTGISWTDHTFNPWKGCVKVSPGCEFCYAEHEADKRYGQVQWGPNGTRVRTTKNYWRGPHGWSQAAMNEGRRARVFCASWADVFEDWSGPILDSKGRRLCLFEDGKTIKPLLECECPNSRWRFLTMDDCRRDLFRLIDATPRLDWLLLTKRPENIRRMVPYFDGAEMSGDLQYRHNVWYGTTTENQKYADERIHHLVHGCRDLSPVLFVSAEPLLGELRLQHDFDGEKVRNWLGEGGINWVISGGESGPKARPSHPDWHRSLRDQCVAAGVPFHFKQWGEFAPVDNGMALGGIHAFADSEDCVMRVDKKAAGRLLDGKLWDQFPCD